MTYRLILSGKVNLVQDDEKGKYVINKSGHRPYSIDPESGTGMAIELLDSRIQAQERRILDEKRLSTELANKLGAIRETKIYKIFHRLGMM